MTVQIWGDCPYFNMNIMQKFFNEKYLRYLEIFWFRGEDRLFQWLQGLAAEGIVPSN